MMKSKKAMTLAEIVVSMCLFATIAMLFMHVTMKAIDVTKDPLKNHKEKRTSDAFNYAKRLEGVVTKMDVPLPATYPDGSDIDYAANGTDGLVVRISRANIECTKMTLSGNDTRATTKTFVKDLTGTSPTNLPFGLNMYYKKAVGAIPATAIIITVLDASSDPVSNTVTGTDEEILAFFDNLMVTYPQAIQFKGEMTKTSLYPKPNLTFQSPFVVCAPNSDTPFVAIQDDIAVFKDVKLVPDAATDTVTADGDPAKTPLGLKFMIYGKTLDAQAQN